MLLWSTFCVKTHAACRQTKTSRTFASSEKQKLQVSLDGRSGRQVGGVRVYPTRIGRGTVVDCQTVRRVDAQLQTGCCIRYSISRSGGEPRVDNYLPTFLTF